MITNARSLSDQTKRLSLYFPYYFETLILELILKAFSSDEKTIENLTVHMVLDWYILIVRSSNVFLQRTDFFHFSVQFTVNVLFNIYNNRNNNNSNGSNNIYWKPFLQSLRHGLWMDRQNTWIYNGNTIFLFSLTRE